MDAGYDIDYAEESDMLERATEKLDVYVRLCLDEGRRERAREFLADGRYVRFAKRGFVEQLFERHPWIYSNSPNIDMKRVCSTLTEALSGEMDVVASLEVFNIIRIDVHDDVFILLNLYCLPGHIEVTIEGPDDDSEWKFPVAVHQSDDFAISQIEEGVNDPFALTEENLDEFCGAVLYLHGVLGRVGAMAEDKAGKLAERYGLQT